MALKVSVIVPTYNQPGFLHLVLCSFEVQTCRDFELLVADDGSGPETRELVEGWRVRGPFPIRHVWHEDEGFRKTVILNEAVKQSSGDYLIFNDGDCLAHPRFVASHVEFARPNGFAVGRTPRLSRRLTARVTEERVRSRKAQRMTLGKVADYLFGESKKMEFGSYIGNRALFELVQRTKKNLDLWGGNFSCFKSDYVKVNGFNEEFIGWGKEDLELGIRFRNLGLRPVSVANRAINFHLWHPKPGRRSYNVALQNRIKKSYRDSGEYYCPLGYANH